MFKAVVVTVVAVIVAVTMSYLKSQGCPVRFVGKAWFLRTDHVDGAQVVLPFINRFQSDNSVGIGAQLGGIVMVFLFRLCLVLVSM